MTLRAGLLLLCCPLVGCATARVVRLDTGEGMPIVYTPARRVPPVEIDQRAFEKAMTTLLLEMKFSLNDEGNPHLRFASAMEEPGGRYHRWCSQQSSPDECLSLLEGNLSLADAGVRRQLALSFAWDGVWDGVAAEIRGIVNPDMLKLMISTAFAAYIGLLILPEPVTKVVAVALTTFLVAYVGLEVFFNILNGWRELSARSERAVSFRELEDAGHRFGDVMGRDGARVIIMAVTAALGGGAANLASKAPTLPAFARAALAARTNVGVELSVALEGGARSVTVAEGVMTVGLAPNVVAAVAAGSPGTTIRPAGLGSDAAEGVAGFSSAELGIVNEVRGIPLSQLRAVFEAGGGELSIGGRTIVVAPEMPASGMTLFGENGFVLGREAFVSDAELTRTLLHEVYRLTTSQSAAGVSGALASEETTAAFSFARRAWEVFFR